VRNRFEFCGKVEDAVDLIARKVLDRDDVLHRAVLISLPQFMHGMTIAFMR
jgi:hypothetical protein